MTSIASFLVLRGVRVMTRKDLVRTKDLEVHLTTPVVVRGYNESGAPFEECANTMTVSANGCLFELTTPVRNEQLLLLRNVKTEEETLCHVVARANNENEFARVKVDFVSPSPWFWRLTFPVEDWNPTSGEWE
jgi:hypothetical protein